jgi:hypothetical protein
MSHNVLKTSTLEGYGKMVKKKTDQSRWLAQNKHSRNILIVTYNISDFDGEPHNTYENCGHIRIISKTMRMKIHN